MDTPEEWWRRIEGKRLVALHMKEDRRNAVEAWDACGTSVEFALKAVILKRERWNRWPDKADRPDLYTHDLRRLMALAGLDSSSIPRPMMPRFKTVLSWSRENEYQSALVPRRQARQIYEHAFGPDGVIEWLKTL